LKRIQDYRNIVGDEIVSEIYRKAGKLYGKRIIHINATYTGGGVAEMLNSLAPLMTDAGVDTDWRIIRGNPDFFQITKKFHNALQGDSVNLSAMKKKLYCEANEDYSAYAHLDHDCVIIHDPQPLPLIEYYKKRQPWAWRCHIDLSHPNKELWDYLKGFILHYDQIIISHETYIQPGLPIQPRIFHPVIDPLSSKNIDLSAKDISKYLQKFNVPLDKPLITQISRFDKWKDPLGVVDVFNLVKEKVDCRLVLCGSMASDDPEGIEIYQKVLSRVKSHVTNGDIILITSENNILVNALQRVSAVIVQKSLREGFGLTVTEALWKETPVVASNVGGIPLQIQDGETGYLVEPTDKKMFAERIIEILKNPANAREMGKKGKEFVKKHFLITRLVMDYFDLVTELIN
jgi:trehalose synthase